MYRIILWLYIINIIYSHTWNDEPLVIYQTHDGITSHLSQLNIACRLAYNISRQLIIIPFYSKHYPDLSTVDLLDYFILPDCIQQDRKVIEKVMSTHRQGDCVILDRVHKPNKYSTYYSTYRLPEETRIIDYDNFDFQSAKCIATFFLCEGVLDHQIKNKYHDILQSIVSGMIRSVYPKMKYTTVHWRRGDQLDGRCRIVQNDRSVNCGDVDSFLKEVSSTMARLPERENMYKYVSTNEQNQTILDYIHNKNYHTMADISKYLVETLNHPKLNSAEEFIIDVLLMCTSNYNMFWGKSEIHWLLIICRRKNHLLIIDNGAVYF